MGEEVEPFSGIGSILMVDVARFTILAEGLSPEELAKVMSAHLEHVCSSIAKHGGTIYLYVGDAVIAYWLGGEGEAGHAKSAVRAARGLLAKPCHDDLPGGARIALDLSIGSGEMVGTHFGPVRQFQIVGAAYSIANRLARAQYLAPGALRISQFTLEALGPNAGFERVGSIDRSPLAPLEVFAAAH
jgi:adenylate cyclase